MVGRHAVLRAARSPMACVRWAGHDIPVRSPPCKTCTSLSREGCHQDYVDWTIDQVRLAFKSIAELMYPRSLPA
jgi:hypothetical protein